MEGESKGTDAKRNFILQQGFPEPPPGSCPLRFSGLMFQPRVVGSIVLLALVLQSPAIFLILSGVLWWSALFPRWNPFDAIYNRTFGSRAGAMALGPAPLPRRFSQGMAASFMSGIGLLLLFQKGTAALVLEAMLLVALVALNLGRFCLGSFVFHLIRGDAGFAVRTLPWKRDA